MIVYGQKIPVYHFSTCSRSDYVMIVAIHGNEIIKKVINGITYVSESDKNSWPPWRMHVKLGTFNIIMHISINCSCIF